MSCRFVAGLFLLLSISSRPSVGEPIHDAARQGDLSAVMMSLDQGVGVDTADVTGETPLIAASLAGHSELGAALIKRGAKIGARNDRGLTALDAASYAGELQSVQLLIRAGASVNDAENKFKVTPLILAAEGDHPLVINYLVEHGADLELRERGGYTALSRAVFKKHTKAIETLLKSGAACQSEEIIGAWALECTKSRAAMRQ